MDGLRKELNELGFSEAFLDVLQDTPRTEVLQSNVDDTTYSETKNHTITSASFDI